MWTDDQRNAIKARDGTVLVSAAAGSGKTAVLIERIIETITDVSNPCDIDKLLIVTFTRAATAEIRARLFKAVNEKLKDLIDNKAKYKDFEDRFKHLKRQQMLIPSANIYTIDAFCTNLVRENFESLSIPPDFSIIDETEGEKLKEEALSEILEKYYAKSDKEFENLVGLFMSDKSDNVLEETILRVYDFAAAFANPLEVLSASLSDYVSGFTYRDSMYVNYIREAIYQNLCFFINKTETYFDECCKLEPLYSTHKNYGAVFDDLACANTIKKHLEDFEIDKAVAQAQAHKFETWSSKREGFEGLKANLETFKILQDYRTTLRDIIRSIPELFVENEADIIEDIKTIRPSLELLIKIVQELDEKFKELKLLEHSLDFTDVERYALSLLQNEDGERSNLARDLSIRFVEILIDEYQDTNDLQDTIFRRLSNNENNLFMVGDVKQSIYGFRNAMPNIFNKKRHDFTQYDEKNPVYPAKITLGFNFRSREGILNYINFVFEQIMSYGVGEVDYNSEEKLYYYTDGQYKGKPVNEPETEIHIFDLEKDTDKLAEETNFVVEYIKNEVEVKKTAKYSDFAILMQKTKGTAPFVERVLKDNDIPVYSETSSSFLATRDVMVMTSFLKCINNPTLDIPLIATLSSPIYGFTPDDLADISKIKQRTYFAKLGEGRSTNPKYDRFLTDLERYRRLSISLPAGELIRTIYEETSFPQIAGAMPNGSQRIANLMLLQEYADAFDQTNSFGISSFIRYLESIEENGGELATASLSSSGDNVVKIMSIHKSKGLEFKYCFLINTAKEFNTTELKQNLLFDSDLGLGIKGRNPNTGSTYQTIMYVAVHMAKQQKLFSEFERVLYVALTRAKEKLIITGSICNFNPNTKAKDTYMDKYATLIPDVRMHPSKVIRVTSFLNWILMATIRHPSAAPLRALFSEGKSCYVFPTSDCRITCVVHNQNDEKTTLATPAKPTSVDATLKKDLEDRINFEYKYLPLSKVSTKRAASKLQEEGFNEAFFATKKPAFLSETQFTAAERGTCLHKFMQYVKLKEAQENLEGEISRLKENNFLSDEELKIIDYEKIQGFLTSSIYKRIENSPKVYKEKKFSILVPATDYDETLPKEFENEKILIQGIADLIFEEDGKLIIVDYKTDRITSDEQLIERHKPQIEIYAKALAQVLGKPVQEAYLYSFCLDHEIKVI